MKAAIVINPVAVAISSNNVYIHSYKRGIIDSTKCGTNIDHAVLVVGYGTDKITGLEYWLIMNSWNPTWGD